MFHLTQLAPFQRTPGISVEVACITVFFLEWLQTSLITAITNDRTTMAARRYFFVVLYQIGLIAGIRGLILPPVDRMRMGVFEQEAMEEECLEASEDFKFFYEVDAEKNIRLRQESSSVWLPVTETK
jgi:hypothetical protein